MKQNIETTVKNGISYDEFVNRLFEIHDECNHEIYLAEVMLPLLRMCCTEKTKIVPIFDDRNTGRKTETPTTLKNRMITICAEKEDGTYVVPDYIFVPLEYSFNNPQKPYLMVETKNPIITMNRRNKKDLSKYYRPLSYKQYDTELIAEIKACDYLIYTDGLTWMFLELKDTEIVESDKYKSISLITLGKKYYETYALDESISELTQWNKLKDRINTLLMNISENPKGKIVN